MIHDVDAWRSGDLLRRVHGGTETIVQIVRIDLRGHARARRSTMPDLALVAHGDVAQAVVIDLSTGRERAIAYRTLTRNYRLITWSAILEAFLPNMGHRAVAS